MAKKFFRYVPDFDYVSRLSKAQNISDYVRVKNLFKRTRISEQVFNDLTYFTKYQIISDERPDNVAFKIYGDSNLDWLILIANNIINLQQEWPLEHKSYYDFLISKYGSDAGIQGIHHYEITQSSGPQTANGPDDFSHKIEVNETEAGAESVSNYEYERREQDRKRQIKLLDP